MNLKSARRGLTLIELLVVVFILTTLVAGVIPVLSPNNDARKIRTATRGLQTFITLAQAEAARTGRPHGIAFRESSPGSGVALEVFQISVPPAFAGFSADSRVVVQPVNELYGESLTTLLGKIVNGGTRFRATYQSYPLYTLSFVLADGTDDILPRRMFRIGDQIDVDGNQFLVIDDPNPLRNELVGYPQASPIEDQEFFLEPPTNTALTLFCVWMNNSVNRATGDQVGQLLPPQGLKRYKINRQPSSSLASATAPGATVEAAYQLPSGVAIDLQGSTVEGAFSAGTPLFPSLADPVGPASFDDITDVINPPTSPSLAGHDTVSIMFAPSGAVTWLLHNNTEIGNASRIILLVGRVENGGLQVTTNGDSITDAPWVLQSNATADQLKTKQQEINWLNLDSRWMTIAMSSGRVTVSENAFVDAISIANAGITPVEQAVEQIEAAHQFARQMKEL